MLLPPLEALLCRTEARENAKAVLMALIRRVLPTAVLASLLVVKAGAEKPPQLMPTRDVDIIYEVTLPSQTRIRGTGALSRSGAVRAGRWSAQIDDNF